MFAAFTFGESYFGQGPAEFVVVLAPKQTRAVGILVTAGSRALGVETGAASAAIGVRVVAIKPVKEPQVM